MMKYNKKDAIQLINDKLNHKSMMTYKEIAEITGYHPKYILKLKKEIVEQSIQEEHGNKGKKSHHSIPVEEEEKIVNLYKRSNASIRKFCKFYGKRSYSCIYQILKRNGLLEKKTDKSVLKK